MTSAKLLLEDTKQELDDLKEEYHALTKMASHDISASLRQIEGFSKLISERNDKAFDPETRTFFNQITCGAARAKEQLSALLEYSLLEAPQDPDDIVNCNDIVKQAQELLAPLIHQAQPEMKISDLPCILGDKHNLTLLFYHLLKNALTYHKPDSAIKISISVTKKLNEYQFTVQDNGLGFHEKMIDKMFVVLRRGTSDHEQYPGLGMGLAIAKKIVKLHGGVIWIENNTDAGCSVHFTLPHA